MFEVLTPADYAQVKPLVSGLQDQTMALAVLDGTRPGNVLANDKRNPSTIFIAAPEGAFVWTYLAGHTDDSVFQQDLNGWLFDDRALGQDVAFSFLVCDSQSWEPALAAILRPRVVIPDRRLLYTCTQRPESWHGTIPAGYSIQSIDQDLLNSGIEIPEKVSQWLDSNFGSRAAFLDHGLGAVAIHDNQIIAWCLADSVVRQRTDIGVETDEAHQRRGLAYCTTCRTLEQAFDRGLKQIGWHCHLVNVPSVKTAEKAGFQCSYEYPAYAVHFDVEKHSKLADIIGDEIVGQASEALEKGDYREAHGLFDRGLGFFAHDDPDIYLLAARAAVRCGDSNTAFARLTSAVLRGWTTMDEGVCPEFVQLQSDPRWLDLVG
jgi:RimJ/RimL family protein N-acetyltransferase